MKKEYIRDDGKVRLCASNIAKMNIFEGMYYMRSVYWYNINQAINDFIVYYYIIINILLIPIMPFLYPFMVLYEIQKAKKDVIKNACT